MNRAAVEAQLAELPLAEYVWFETAELEFSERIRTVCRENCPRYNKTWACPPAVGSVEACRARCLSYPQGLLITSLTEDELLGDPERPNDTAHIVSPARIPQGASHHRRRHPSFSR